MSQEISARLLPQKPSKWAKILLNRKVPIFLFFLLELAFLVFSYLSLQEHFPSIILWEHLLSVFTFFYLLNRSMDSRSKLSWLIIIALFPIFGTALLYFSLADFGVRRLKKRLVEATQQASDYLAPIQKLLIIYPIVIANYRDWLIFWSIVQLSFLSTETQRLPIFHLEMTCFRPCWRI